MAVSGSFNYVINRREAITKAAEECGAIEVGGTIPEDINDFFAAQLNLMLKNWHGASLQDLFRLRRTILLLQTDQVKYDLGSSTSNDHWVFEDDLTETFVNGDQTVISTNNTLTVDSTTGMSVSDNVAVEMEDGSMDFTTVATVDSSTTFTAASGQTWADDIDDDDRVFFYTNRAPRPYAILNAWRRERSDATKSTVSDRQGTDTPVRIIPREEYLRLGAKRAEGPINEIFYDPQVGGTPATPAGHLFVFPEPNDVGVRLVTYAAYPFDDMDADEDDFACPQHWFLPIILGLAKRGFNAYGTPTALKTEVKEQFAEAWLNAISARNIGGSMQFVPYNEGSED